MAEMKEALASSICEERQKALVGEMHRLTPALKKDAAKLQDGKQLHVRLRSPSLLGLRGPGNWVEQERGSIRRYVLNACKTPEDRITIAEKNTTDDFAADILQEGDPTTSESVAIDDTGSHASLTETALKTPALKTPEHKPDASEAAAQILKTMRKRPRTL